MKPSLRLHALTSPLSSGAEAAAGAAKDVAVAVAAGSGVAVGVDVATGAAPQPMSFQKFSSVNSLGNSNLAENSFPLDG